MPESLMQECYVMLVSDSYQNLSPTYILNYVMPSLQGCMPCIFVINVVTRTTMQTRSRDVADFSPCSAVILMPCKLDATKRSMHILRYFSKDVLNI